MNLNKKYGLVLEGGGARGAYHIGSYFALKELGFEFETVVGTSIGAINAAMIAMGEPEKCAKLWRSVTMEDYLKDSSKEVTTKKDEDKNQDLKDELIDSIKNVINDTINNITLPVEPLKNLVDENIDEDKVRRSKIRFGLVTVNVTDKKAEELYIEDIPRGELKKYLVASCYLPIFKMEPLDGKYYLDGGFYNNIPYDMVEKLGQTPVIIRCKKSKVNNIYMPKDALIIEPAKKYASSVDFDPIRADEIIRIGYFDTYKKIKGLMGNKYYIKPFEEEKAAKILSEIYFDILDSYIDHNKYKISSNYRRFFEEVLPDIASKHDLKGDYTYAKLLVLIVEKLAKELNIDYLNIYDIDSLLEKIKNKEEIESGKDKMIEKLAKRIMK